MPWAAVIAYESVIDESGVAKQVTDLEWVVNPMPFRDMKRKWSIHSFKDALDLSDDLHLSGSSLPPSVSVTSEFRFI